MFYTLHVLACGLAACPTSGGGGLSVTTGASLVRGRCQSRLACSHHAPGAWSQLLSVTAAFQLARALRMVTVAVSGWMVGGRVFGVWSVLGRGFEREFGKLRRRSRRRKSRVSASTGGKTIDGCARGLWSAGDVVRLPASGSVGLCPAAAVADGPT